MVNARARVQATLTRCLTKSIPMVGQLSHLYSAQGSLTVGTRQSAETARTARNHKRTQQGHVKVRAGLTWRARQRWGCHLAPPYSFEGERDGRRPWHGSRPQEAAPHAQSSLTREPLIGTTRLGQGTLGFPAD